MSKVTNELIKIAKDLHAAYGRLTKVENRRYRDNTINSVAKKSTSWDEVKIKEDVLVEAYTFDEFKIMSRGELVDVYSLMIWTGNSKKYIFMNFRDKSKRDSELKRILNNAISTEKRKKDRRDEARKERNEFKHDFKVGDYLYTSWGYDQTNIDYYIILDVTEKSVKIKECKKKIVGSSNYEDLVIPSNSTTGSVMNKRVSPDGSVKIHSFAYARKWDGKPLGKTASGHGH